jgi:hypothetical protein
LLYRGYFTVRLICCEQANTLYVLWVAAFNTSFLLGYVLLDSIFAGPSYSLNARPNNFTLAKERLSVSSPMRNSFAPSFKFPVGSDAIRDRTPQNEAGGSGLLYAINLNGLALFLVVRARANL